MREKAKNGRSKQGSSNSCKLLFRREKQRERKSSKSPEITYANGLTASWKHENAAPTTIPVECLVAFIKVCMGPIT